MPVPFFNDQRDLVLFLAEKASSAGMMWDWDPFDSPEAYLDI